MPLIINKKKFIQGAVMLSLFLACVVTVFLPVFNGKTGMQAADDLFNSLSKGSSYYIPEVREEAGQYRGLELNVPIKVESQEQMTILVKLFEGAGATAAPHGEKLLVKGNFGAITEAALTDADDLFLGGEDKVKAKYSTIEARHVIYHWHKAFGQIEEYLIQEKMHEESLFVKKVMTRALEPSYNFAGIAAFKVGEKVALTGFLLTFYIIYTLWYGFGVMFLFEGLGIVASHGTKKEA